MLPKNMPESEVVMGICPVSDKVFRKSLGVGLLCGLAFIICLTLNSVIKLDLIILNISLFAAIFGFPMGMIVFGLLESFK